MASFSSRTFWPPPMDRPTSPPFHSSPIPSTCIQHVSVQTTAQSTYYHHTFIYPHAVNEFKNEAPRWEAVVSHWAIVCFLVWNKSYLHIEVEVVCWLHETVEAIRLLCCNSEYKQFFWRKIIKRRKKVRNEEQMSRNSTIPELYSLKAWRYLGFMRFPKPRHSLKSLLTNIYLHIYVALCLHYEVDGIVLLQTKLQPNLKPMSTLARLIPKVHPFLLLG